MINWIRLQWANACEGPNMIVLDVHRAQKTDNVSSEFEATGTIPVYVPPGCTSLVQPLDVSFNSPFKAIVGRLAREHMANNLDCYVEGSIPASERRVLFTQWVGQAWEEVSMNTRMVVRSFKKCGISVPIDGSEDDEINIEGIPSYQVGDELSCDTSTYEEDSESETDPFNSDSD